jgi:DNA-binding CsgD family transcriptional regulator
MDLTNLTALAEQLNISERTLKEDIDMIVSKNEIFDLTYYPNHIGLKFQNNQSIQTVYQYILTNSDGFRLIEVLLYKGAMTMNEMADYLFISKSTIYRFLPAIKVALEDQYNISISNTPLSFLGKEEDIRYFLGQFVEERYLQNPLPLDEFHEKLLEQFLLAVSEIIGTEMNYITVNIIKKAIYVNYVRTKLGYLVNEKPIREEIIAYCLSDKVPFYPILTNYFNHIDLPLDREDMMQIFSGFLDKQFYYNVEELIQAATTDEIAAASYTQLNLYLTTLSEHFSIPLINKDLVIWAMHASTFIYKSEIKANYILYNRKGKFVQKVKELFPESYYEAYHFVERYLTSMGIEKDPTFADHLFYTLFSHWQYLSTTLIQSDRPIKAVIFSNLGIYHAQMLESQLALSFADLISFTVYTKPSLDYETLPNDGFNLMIANHPLPRIVDMETVTIQTFPMHEDIMKIYNACNNIKQHMVLEK